MTTNNELRPPVETCAGCGQVFPVSDLVESVETITEGCVSPDGTSQGETKTVVLHFCKVLR
ncbi:MAG: hypothetical protein FJ271_31670 [Planctomycetes bacterium]|nr:hypothetical protein [Planctomycetota bacterium]